MGRGYYTNALEQFDEARFGYQLDPKPWAYATLVALRWAYDVGLRLGATKHKDLARKWPKKGAHRFMLKQSLGLHGPIARVYLGKCFPMLVDQNLCTCTRSEYWKASSRLFTCHSRPHALYDSNPAATLHLSLTHEFICQRTKTTKRKTNWSSR